MLIIFISAMSELLTERFEFSGTNSNVSLAHKRRPRESCREAFSGKFAGSLIIHLKVHTSWDFFLSLFCCSSGALFDALSCFLLAGCS